MREECDTTPRPGGRISMTSSAQEARFSSLIEGHKKILFKVCNTYCRHPGDRNDLAQEIVIQLWRSFDRYDPRLKFSTWLYRIAINVAISFHRKNDTWARHTVPTDVHLLEVASDSEGPEASLDLQALHGFIDRLDEMNKALILLYLDGNDSKTIAEVLGITETNVTTKINRIKTRLRQDFLDGPHPEARRT
jgi:RNA polymerase sigma-70 factor, ECF subfamily